ncbi:MAG: hypothetical protein AAFV33_08455 [Chloroflexota bacterium]
MNNPDLFPQIVDGVPVSDGTAHNLRDGFALAWIFTATLAAGLVMLYGTVPTLFIALFSWMLGAIWWGLSHYRRRS